MIWLLCFTPHTELHHAVSYLLFHCLVPHYQLGEDLPSLRTCQASPFCWKPSLTSPFLGWVPLLGVTLSHCPIPLSYQVHCVCL